MAKDVVSTDTSTLSGLAKENKLKVLNDHLEMLKAAKSGFESAAGKASASALDKEKLANKSKDIDEQIEATQKQISEVK